MGSVTSNSYATGCHSGQQQMGGGCGRGDPNLGSYWGGQAGVPPGQGLGSGAYQQPSNCKESDSFIIYWDSPTPA